ncbi:MULTISPECIES: 30S ribosomal protein S19 [Desulfurobacteriaceae]|jgi:small subunit ribosomal protein S19|uniref:Small ribosomal subunit protein uS19 n=3 Tax=Desulfurobacteriaceae TaxID=558314 RepID=A0A521CUD2_9BACT|nr:MULTISPECIES: 30S ribosomal protein S19 [Desulfurobacteriaceae]ADU96234.1 ribosomal protein S19 [Thermovibrio ammonificans HB-1]RKQ61905.1 SSU ribosomal protein S19P [Thermovibrio guaymasensis]SMO63025.1 SSU ribosomal protein S19P [Balnearium lithotrophicum]
MGRSLKKGPYVNPKILKKVRKMNETGEKKVIKVWDRACTIVPEFIGHTFAVYNGQKFIPVYVTEQMVGHRLGEFSLTRTFRGHAGQKVAKKK